MKPAPAYDEQTTLNELVFALGGRDEPTVALVECASLAKRRELEAEMAQRLPEYQFFPLDVTPYIVNSLINTLAEHLPADIQQSKPVSWVVNVHGLENSRSLSSEGQLVPSPLTAQFNLERELLFRRVPYLIVLWGDADFFRTLQREAPDFWHWATYRFRFEDHEARLVAELPPLPEFLPERGNVVERQARIAELRERYDHLALDDSDKKRLLKDKIDILTLLGAEYHEAFSYPEAAKAYQTAIVLQERMQATNEAQGYLWFELGIVYCDDEQFALALSAYEECKKLSTNENMASIFHQIGMVHYKQQEWEAALLNYNQALDWNRQFQDNFQRGNTFHQIGMLYGAQQQWALALDNYRQALKWRKRVGDDFKNASTYHQMGMTYWYQSEWVLALENLQQAMVLMQQAGDEYGTGTTSQIIGRVYVKQQRYAEAIVWLRRSAACLAKYGHPNTAAAEDFLAHVMQLQRASRNKKAREGAKQKSARKKKVKITAVSLNSKKG
jgi:tetratricopeptide (TPR) repeat protein